jgi:sigma-B regulation protein RsbU (phosphoserine phosphatase)
MLQGSVSRMSGLIDNVLDFARGRLGTGIPLNLRSDIALTPVLEQVVSELRTGTPERAIETDFHLNLPVCCDPSRIGQLLSNLLGNALTHGARAKPVRVYADTDGGELTIWVANGGDPILPAALERLFQPFFRGQVKPSQQGLGLGLYIASEIARAHGGTLTATSDRQETRFTFRMPVATR